MTFMRAFIVACMTAALVQVREHDGGFVSRLLGDAIVFLIFGAWWRFATSDPLPDAVKRGLEDFARAWRARS